MTKGIYKHPLLSLSILVVCLFSNFQLLSAQTTNYYFVSFSDKTGSPHTLDKPEFYLSDRSIERRLAQGIKIDSTDLGVSTMYVDSLKKLQISVLHTSKWLNGAIVSSANQPLMDTLGRLSFIKDVLLSKGSNNSTSAKFKNENESLKATEYGAATKQISTVNGIALHQLGYTGGGMHIAVIDAGFYKANELPTLQHLYDNNQILGTKDFVNPNSNIYNEHQHGMNVLSIIGGYIEGTFCGTAPDASFWLLRTEDSATEYPIEGDNWVCAAEFADSAGVDVINTSLGYTTFDNAEMNLFPADLNGSSRISMAADLAAKKGMVVIVSAGNEGNNTWRYISTPSDPESVLSIGAMNSDSTLAAFSSVGYPPINIIKPDVTAMGAGDAFQGSDGNIKFGSGTSFSAPVVTGLAACLWQSLPNFTSNEIVQLIRQSSHQYSTPDLFMGYGIPDFHKAYLIGNGLYNPNPANVSAWPNPFTTKLTIYIHSDKGSTYQIKLFNSSGQLVLLQSATGPIIRINQLDWLPIGIYLLSIEGDNLNETIKLQKE